MFGVTEDMRASPVFHSLYPRAKDIPEHFCMNEQSSRKKQVQRVRKLEGLGGLGFCSSIWNYVWLWCGKQKPCDHVQPNVHVIAARRPIVQVHDAWHAICPCAWLVFPVWQPRFDECTLQMQMLDHMSTLLDNFAETRLAHLMWLMQCMWEGYGTLSLPCPWDMQKRANTCTRTRLDIYSFRPCKFRRSWLNEFVYFFFGGFGFDHTHSSVQVSWSISAKQLNDAR